ncbi:MAG TPA: matrixin family metalloprotease [Clostridiales bacterium]|nr:matrixin family metalloprotease [Clostridiales bacterium]
MTLAFLLSSICVFLTQDRKAYSAEYNLQSWWLVDSGKHLDWDGTCSYMDQWYEGVRVWNAYKPGVIRVDTFWIIEDVKISDFYNNNTNVVGVCSSNGTIKFNKYHMDKLNNNGKLSVVIHEIGHALGIAHNDNYYSIMYPYFTGHTKLFNCDKAAYDAAYKKY